jgi:hypothetical protein
MAKSRSIGMTIDYHDEAGEDVREYLTKWLSWHGTLYTERGW